MTDEQIVDLLDAAPERLQGRFSAQVEAVRVGTIIAHDRRQAARWESRQRQPMRRSRGLVGAELETAIANVAALFPDNVIRQTVAA